MKPLSIDPQLLNSIPAAVYLCDADGCLLQYNDRTAELWGRRPELGVPYERYCGSHRLFLTTGEPLPHEATPMADTLRDGESRHGYEAVIERPDGSRITALVHIDPLRDEAGQVIGAINAFQDITDRKRMEQDLEDAMIRGRSSEARLRSLLEQNADGILLFDANGVISWCSPSVEQFTGYPTAELLGRDVGAFIHPDDFPKADQDFQALLQSPGGAVHSEVRYRRTDGEWRILKCRYRNLLHDPAVAALVANVHDVTDQRRMEDALRLSEERFRVAAEASSDILYELDVATGDVRTLGRSHSGALKGPGTLEGWKRLLHPEDQARVLRALDVALETGEPFSEEYRTRCDTDSSWRIVWDRGQAIPDARGRFTRFVGGATDVTASRRAEHEANARVRQQEAVAELGCHALAGEDLATLIPAAVQVVSEQLNVSLVALTQRDLDGRLRYRAGTGWRAGAMEATLAEAGADSHSGFTLMKNGPLVFEDLHAETRFRPRPVLFDHHVTSGVSVLVQGNGHPWGVLAAYSPERRHFSPSDLHFLQGVANVLAAALLRERTERELRRNEMRFRRLSGSHLFGYLEADEKGTILAANATLLDMLGYTEADLNEGRLSWSAFVPPRLADSMTHALDRLAESGVYNPFEKAFLHRDGREIPILCGGAMLEGEERPRLAAFILDLTTQKKLEAELVQAQKMEAVGRLAGGVAHDFNNMLAVINGYGDLLASRLPQDDPLQGYVHPIKEAGKRAADLTQQLLAFSRKQVLRQEVFHLDEVVGAIHKLLRRLIGEDIELSIRCAPGTGAVRADPAQIEQVVMNLALNARDAMPDGGRLSVEVENLSLARPYPLNGAAVPPGDYITLAVTDNGVGMSRDTLDHLFEPFFTTKEMGKGTGLGLATTYGVVKQSGGYIEVTSEEGRGSRFRILLPRVEEAAPVAASPAMEPLKRGTETVLLVEDEAMVREFVRETLRECGYRVLEARDGREALRLSETTPEPIHLLLTDVVMPTMNGRALAEALAVPRPDTKVIFMSGYTDDEALRGDVATDHVTFLQKPVSPVRLSETVRRALDARIASA